MRVIAGIHKGRQLKAVPGNNTRPTTDKVKESIFQIIGPFFRGGKALDLFAGSGSLGIEALSRGMDYCIFVDKHPKAIKTIHENTSLLRLDDQIEVFRTDAYRALAAVAKRELSFDIIFLDPPYSKISYADLLEIIRKEHLLNEDGIIYCEHDVNDELPEQVSGLNLIKQTKYGGTIGVTIYQKM
ncbi:16S rRNA (guanine(966)-N(2))-methyltransferase RsmD [Paucisalibacillus sp. EB02]|uniref:16S rRNA (guanine(966)-N(2))-methyltransferase RsmD n=1 Tax=Paucisalibacillus sp. EB02 TaxID=1347087 RepID=UPI0004B0AEB3|nr:16S rRNA (guanine(966)-N(2))-methyltransferase RsmD [Paucisalibacillus sp. EB02]